MHSVMKKMSKAIQNDEMIGQAFEPKQTQTTYVMRIKIDVKNDVGKKCSSNVYEMFS